VVFRVNEGPEQSEGSAPPGDAFGPLVASRTVYRWDLDKTYLRTEFDTARDLVRTAFETPQVKQTVPGAKALFHELAKTGPRGIHILSGSPEQMRRVLEAKLRQDGVAWSEFVLKPSLDYLVRGKFRFLKDQLGYKLGVLLASRAVLGAEPEEILFGDDAEADAFIYSLYADLCRGEVSREVLDELLVAARVYDEDRAVILARAERIERRDCVRRVFIHLDRVSAPDAFDAFGGRVCPIYNYFQTALVLLEEGALTPAATLRVGAEVVAGNGFSPDALFASYRDVAARGLLSPLAASALLAEAAGTHAAGPDAAPSASMGVVCAFAAAANREPVAFRPPPARLPPAVDYPAVFAVDRARARAGKARALWRRG
jgi:hypothetical protein